MSAHQDRQDYNKTLQDQINQLKADKEALQKEFNQVADEGKDTSPEAIKKAFIAAVPTAIERIISLAAVGDSDSIQLTASKFIIEVAAGRFDPKNVDGKENQVFDAFLKKLMNDKAKKPATT